MGREGRPERVDDIAQDILELWRRREENEKLELTSATEAQSEDPQNFLPLDPPYGHYDFDLAEFPLFRLYKNRLATYDEEEPIVYTDIIKGRDGRKIAREWKVYPSRYGFGGPSTQVLFYDLLQLYIEQGARDRFIHFGTLRSLFQRQGNRNPSKRDYERMRRDIEILRGIDFHGKNAFWDSKRQTYMDMNWRPFGDVFYPEEKSGNNQLGLPYSCIEVSSVLQTIAQDRGFFALGFNSKFYHDLKPLEQRLAVYLAKKFGSQKIHHRFVDDLAKALPIEAAQPKHVRMILKRAIQGLFDKNFPLLSKFAFKKSRDGRYLAVFHRKARPKRDNPLPASAAKELALDIAFLVNRIIKATGDEKSRPFWAKCAETVGQGGVDRALGQLRETCEIRQVRSRGAMLNKIFKDIAREQGVTIH